jgi:hypothetical protein
MSLISDYMFNSMSRIGNDLSDVSQKNIQNVKLGNYQLNNLYTSDNEMNSGIALALKQPTINYSGTNQTALNGTNIDINSNLLIDKNMLHSKGKVSLQERQYLCTPYLGKGKVDSSIEHGLFLGERESNRKTINGLSEKSFLPLKNTPMIPEVERNIQNPKHLIESSVSEGWIRGGLPSREFSKRTIN